MKKSLLLFSKTLSKITTIIYISTKIFGFKNSCNEKTGGYFLFLTVKNDTVDQKSAKYAMKKIKSALYKGLHGSSYFYTNIRNSIARHNTDSRLVSLSKCVIIQVSEHLRGQGGSQVSPKNKMKPSTCFCLRSKIKRYKTRCCVVMS